MSIFKVSTYIRNILGGKYRIGTRSKQLVAIAIEVRKSDPPPVASRGCSGNIIDTPFRLTDDEFRKVAASLHVHVVRVAGG